MGARSFVCGAGPPRNTKNSLPEVFHGAKRVDGAQGRAVGRGREGGKRGTGVRLGRQKGKPSSLGNGPPHRRVAFVPPLPRPPWAGTARACTPRMRGAGRGQTETQQANAPPRVALGRAARVVKPQRPLVLQRVRGLRGGGVGHFFFCRCLGVGARGWRDGGERRKNNVERVASGQSSQKQKNASPSRHQARWRVRACAALVCPHSKRSASVGKEGGCCFSGGRGADTR